MNRSDLPLEDADRRPSVPGAPEALSTGGLTGIKAMIGVLTVIATVTALNLASSVFAPLAFALFILALVWPLQRALQKRMPALPALVVSMVATIAIIATFVWLMTWGVGRVGRSLIGDAPRLQLVYTQAVEWLEGHGVAVSGLWSEHLNAGRLVRLIQQITSWVNGTLSFSLIVFIYVVLGLLEVGVTTRKLGKLVREGRALGTVLLEGGAQTAAKLRRYMLVRSLMSIATGALVFAVTSLAGLELAAEWGVIAFLLNYIPVIGPFIATFAPTLHAVAQFGSWETAVVVFIALNLVQFVVGSVFEPRVAGCTLAISPFIILFAVFFWSFLWGIAGAFIGVPIVIAILTLCEQHPASRWFAELLGGEARTN